MNESPTCGNSDTYLARGRSSPVLYELIDDRGVLRSHHRSHTEATEHQHVGWTVRTAGEFVHHRAAKGPVDTREAS